MLLPKKILLKQIHHNAVDCLSNLSWIWVEQEGLCEAQWTRELKSLKPSSSWLLRWFHGEKDEKNVINFFLGETWCVYGVQ
jgi:hypothetical protein